MIDIAILRENPTLVKENMKKKFQDNKIGLVDEAYKLDKDYREVLTKASELRSKRNKLSKEISSDRKNFKTITNATLSNWENNVYEPDPDSIAILCHILKIDANALLEIEKLKKEFHSKKVPLENGAVVEIITEVPWEQLSEEQQKEIMDSVIEESVKIKKESSKKDS